MDRYLDKEYKLSIFKTVDCTAGLLLDSIIISLVSFHRQTSSLSIYLSINLSIYLFINQAICLFNYLFVCLSIFNVFPKESINKAVDFNFIKCTGDDGTIQRGKLWHLNSPSSTFTIPQEFYITQETPGDIRLQNEYPRDCPWVFSINLSICLLRTGEFGSKQSQGYGDMDIWTKDMTDDSASLSFFIFI